MVGAGSCQRIENSGCLIDEKNKESKKPQLKAEVRGGGRWCAYIRQCHPVQASHPPSLQCILNSIAFTSIKYPVRCPLPVLILGCGASDKCRSSTMNNEISPYQRLRLQVASAKTLILFSSCLSRPSPRVAQVMDGLPPNAAIGWPS